MDMKETSKDKPFQVDWVVRAHGLGKNEEGVGARALYWAERLKSLNKELSSNASMKTLNSETREKQNS